MKFKKAKNPLKALISDAALLRAALEMEAELGKTGGDVTQACLSLNEKWASEAGNPRWLDDLLKPREG